MRAATFNFLIKLCNTRPFKRLLLRLTNARFSRRFIPRYIKMFSVNTEEIGKPLNEFESLNAFFIRELRPGARPLDTNPRHLISPVDCKLEFSQHITTDSSFTIKGQSLTLTELLQSEMTARNFQNGHIFVLYLSPADYHRVHAPFDTRVLHSYKLGKNSWPVNEKGLLHGPRPLCTNYRVVNLLENGSAAIFVGATNVNSIICKPDKMWQKGNEVAYFQFGSTVVLLFKAGQIKPLVQAGEALRMGEGLAEFLFD